MDQCSFSSMKGYSYTFHTLINITLSLDMVRIDNQILQKKDFSVINLTVHKTFLTVVIND